MNSKLNRFFVSIVLGITLIAGAVPAIAADDAINDPLEPVNRVIFEFNDVLDQYLFEPIAKGYKYVMPDYARTRVHRVVVNLKEPLTTVNDLLQGRFVDSGDSLVRFSVNSTVGLAGMYDVVGDQSESKLSDFSDTFADWGVGRGPYLVLPLFGPSSARDTVGKVANYYGDPVSIAVRTSDDSIKNPETVLAIKSGVELLDTRSRLITQVDDMRKNSLDFYASARSIYYQRSAVPKRQDGTAAGNTTPDFN